MPKNITWQERFNLAKELLFDFVEISIDETDEKLQRLDWDKSERICLVKDIIQTDIHIPSMCFSGHRRFPLGSKDEKNRTISLDLMKKSILFAKDIGIRNIQMAGYDVYYEKSEDATKKFYIEGLKRSLDIAAKYQVMLSIEIMDTPFINSITKFMEYSNMFNSPWLTVYPDLGNLSAWGNDVVSELKKGFHKISAIHIKDTIPPSDTYDGKFKEVPFGQGCVDFIKCFKTLKELNYKGPMMIEMWTEKSNNIIEDIISSRDWVLSKLKESGFNKS